MENYAAKVRHSIKMTLRGLVVALPLPLSRWLLLAQEYRRIPALASPRTFNEKINWRIVYDRNPLLVTASSKLLSKDYVASLGTTVKIPRTLWRGVRLKDLEGVHIGASWVMKPSHKSGLVHFGGPGRFVLTPDLPSDDEYLSDDEWEQNRLWGYRMAPKEILLEERLGSPGDDLEDFKFFVFRGEVRMVQVDHGRHDQHTRNLYDAAWRPLEYNYTVPTGVPTDAPERFQEMLEIASTLGMDFDFIRVDLYHLPDGVYFGELTAYPGAGLSRWPRALDELMGDAWMIPRGPRSRHER